jgi:alpha-beta hydrolase superfamily lysophospholipase
MSIVVSPPDQPAAATATEAQRTPFYFQSRGGWLFAWLHRQDNGCRPGQGVVICPPVGYEQIHAHRSLRHLADALARVGFPVLRFDYHGTGDSAGTDEDADRYATWVGNIRDAKTWLQRELGCPRISLVGLRLGATLAVQAAVDEAVDGLVLWAPVVKGRAYVREMKALSLTARPDGRPASEAPDEIEAAGFVLTASTAHDLGRLDLLQAHPRCRRALIVARDDAPDDARLLDHFRALGIDTAQTVQPGYTDMMAEPHDTKVPRQAIGHVVDWLLAGSPDEDRIVTPAETTAPLRQGVEIEPSLRERAVRISLQPDLFGILSEPRDSSAPDLPLVLIVNAGSCYRVGPNRLYVSLARQLAARGFRCLRLDLCGLGDSITPDLDRENDPYPATAFRDIGLVLNYLRTQHGVSRVVLMGLCSGAYAALQSAAQLSDPALVESVLINPLTFFWKEGMSIEADPAARLRSSHDYMASAWQPGKWLKMLTGRSKLGIAGALRMLVDHWRLRKPSGRASTKDHGPAPYAFPTHPPREDLPGDLARLEKAGRHVACFFATTDPGYRILTFYAGKKVNAMRRSGRMSVRFMDGADHTFSRRTARQALAQALIDHLCRRY